MSDEQRGPARQLVERAKHLQGAVEIRWIPEIREARERDLIDICAAADEYDAQVAALVEAAEEALEWLSAEEWTWEQAAEWAEQLRAALEAMMASEPFWKELVPQDELEAQWKRLKQSDKPENVTGAAMHLARFTEARMYERARLALERHDQERTAAAWPQGEQAAEELAAAMSEAWFDFPTRGPTPIWEWMAAAVLARLQPAPDAPEGGDDA